MLRSELGIIRNCYVDCGFIPMVGMSCLLQANKIFPWWEQFIPLMGISAHCSVLILVDSFICYSYTGCQSYDFIPVSVYILIFIPKIVVTPKSLS